MKSCDKKCSNCAWELRLVTVCHKCANHSEWKIKPSDKIKQKPKPNCDCLKFELTPLQFKHKPSIDWLYFGGRQQGRSHLLAICAIEYAIKTGEWVRVRDHFPYYRADTFLMDTIRHMVSGFGKWEFNKLRGEFRYCGKENKEEQWQVRRKCL